MHTADIFKVQNNVTLAFQSMGKEYKMYLLIEDGIIRLEDTKEGKEKVYFIEEPKEYTGEPTEIVEKATKPKKKRSKKKV